nr:MAG TPA: hypothetical protein [Caudoviricetes sp.]
MPISWHTESLRSVMELESPLSFVFVAGDVN